MKPCKCGIAMLWHSYAVTKDSAKDYGYIKQKFSKFSMESKHKTFRLFHF